MLKPINFSKNGIKLIVSVSPCVHMNPLSPLQVQVSLADGSADANCDSAFFTNQNIRNAIYTKDDVMKLAKQVQFGTCKCGKILPRSNKEKFTCYRCFKAELNARVEKSEKRQIARLKNSGMKYRLIAWIHPSSGDDYQIEAGFKTKPTDKEIQSILRKQRSQSLNDYQLTVI